MCVVRPRTVGEVATLLEVASRLKLAVVPYGAGSGVVGASIPNAGAISLDTRQLNQVLEIDTENWLVVVEAGALGGELEETLNKRGFTLGHYPQSLHISTVGGWVATRATGTFSSKYGGIEDCLYSLEVVLPTGEVVQTRNIARSSAGPKLAEIFVGSEGVLGVITRVTLKIYPLPEVRRFRGISFPSVRDGLAAVREMYRSHLVPAVVRLYEEQEAAVLYQAVRLERAQPLLITGVEGLAGIAKGQEQRMLEIASRFGGEDLGQEIGNHWEKHRFNAQWLEVGNAGEGKMADAIDVAANWKELPLVYEEMIQKLRKVAAKVWAHYSHFTAHGGSIYFIVFIDEENAAAARRQYETVWATAMDVVQSLRGSIAHHHGVGLLRLPYLRHEFGSESILLERIKGALDPQRILNPGKLNL